jgi:hypothetical protein
MLRQELYGLVMKWWKDGTTHLQQQR